MTNEEVRDGDSMRTAVALVALRFKPPNQSYEAYALDLRARFAPSKSSRQFEEHSSEALWRDRALALENNLAELQARYDSEHAKVLELAAKGSREREGTPTLPEPPHSSPKKKKGKKKNTETSDPFDQANGIGKARVPAMARPVSPLLTIFTDLAQLISILRCPITPEDAHLLLATTNRALETVASSLRPFLTVEIAPQKRTPSDSLKTLGPLLVYVVESVLPLLSGDLLPNGVPSHEFDAVVNGLMRTILHPIIQSFAPLSLAFLHLCLTFPTTLGPKSDMRQDLLNLLRTVLQSISRLKCQPSCIHESLALNVVHELRKLFLDNPGSNNPTAVTDQSDYINADDENDGTFNPSLNADVTSTGGAQHSDGLSHQGCAPNTGDYVFQGGRDQKNTRSGKRNDIDDTSAIGHVNEARVARLAKKDALWYLCSVLHTIFGPSETTTERSTAASSSVTTSTTENSFCSTETSSHSSTATKWKATQDTMRDRIFTGLCELLRNSGYAERTYDKKRDSCPNVGTSAGEWDAGQAKGHVPAGSHCAKSFFGVGAVGGKAGNVRGTDLALAQSRTEDRARWTDAIGGGRRADDQVDVAKGRRADESKTMPYTGTHPIDKVARGMLLAVVERYWLWSSESYSAV